MANRNDETGGDRNAERMGHGVHEGLNAGVSRNAHDSGSRQSASPDKQRGDAQADGNDQGRGGYGDDTGFTGGTRAAGDEGEVTESRGMKAAPGSAGAHTEDSARIDGVGHQAPSGMDDERESTGEPR